jgi:phosphatidylinositol glycan class M
LLAILLAPNKWLHKSFGKYLFSGCDILAGILMYNLLVSTILPHAHSKSRKSGAGHASPSPHFISKHDAGSPSPRACPNSDDGSKNAALAPISDSEDCGDGDGDGDEDGDGLRRRAALLVSLHLLNPIVIGISTRGSSESVLTLLVLLTLFCALRGRWDCAAAFLGLSAHWKIYPVIYGVSCIGVIGTERQLKDAKKKQTGTGTGGGATPARRPRGERWWCPGIARRIDVFLNAKTARFAVISAGTFLALGVLMYSV